MGGSLQTIDLGGGRGWLEVEAAKSQRRIDRALGHQQQITEAGRTWEQQKKHWDTYQRVGYPIALHPDTPSIHQLGRAKDTNERDTVLMNDHGWFHTVYRNGVLVEPWHYEYFPSKDNHRGENVALIQGADGVWRYEEDDMPSPQEIAAAVWGYPIGYRGQAGVSDRPAWQVLSFTHGDGENNRSVIDEHLEYAHLDARDAKDVLTKPIDDVAEGVPDPITSGTLRQRIAWMDWRARQSEAREVGLQAAVTALASAQGLDPAQIAGVVKAAVDDALKDIQITLTAQPS